MAIFTLILRCFCDLKRVFYVARFECKLRERSLIDFEERGTPVGIRDWLLVLHAMVVICLFDAILFNAFTSPSTPFFTGIFLSIYIYSSRHLTSLDLNRTDD
jgi:hypothetical protein